MAQLTNSCLQLVHSAIAKGPVRTQMTAASGFVRDAAMCVCEGVSIHLQTADVQSDQGVCVCGVLVGFMRLTWCVEDGVCVKVGLEGSHLVSSRSMQGLRIRVCTCKWMWIERV